MIVVSWFYSICAPLIYVLSGSKMVFHPSKFFCYFPIENSAFMAYGIPLYVGIPTCVIIYCYFRIFTTVRHHNSNFHRPGNPISTVNVEEVKVASTILVCVGCQFVQLTLWTQFSKNGGFLVRFTWHIHFWVL